MEPIGTKLLAASVTDLIGLIKIKQPSIKTNFLTNLLLQRTKHRWTRPNRPSNNNNILQIEPQHVHDVIQHNE